MTITARTSTGSTLVDITSGSAQWWADLAVTAGGTGLHPTPHDLLDSALAACTVLTIRLYASRKNYPIEAVQVQVERDQTGATYRMHRRVEIAGPLTDQQRSDILRVANACPVHKTLTGTLEIDTTLV